MDYQVEELQEEYYDEPERVWPRRLFRVLAFLFSLGILFWLLLGTPSFGALLAYCFFLALFALSGEKKEEEASEEPLLGKGKRPVI